MSSAISSDRLSNSQPEKPTTEPYPYGPHVQIARSAFKLAERMKHVEPDVDVDHISASIGAGESFLNTLLEKPDTRKAALKYLLSPSLHATETERNQAIWLAQNHYGNIAKTQAARN